MSRARVLLNMDLGELPDEPEALYTLAHLANIACGGHAGDDTTMREALTRCRIHAARAGAHPSYPDREGFGRRAMRSTPEATRAAVADQCARLAAIGRALGQPIAFMKPHGALYEAGRRDAEQAAAIVRGALEGLGAPFTVVGPARSALAEAAAAAGLSFAREGFADRATLPDGTLVPRDRPGALVLDPAAAAATARRLAKSGEVDTVCVHGDSPGAPEIARAVRDALDALPTSG